MKIEEIKQAIVSALSLLENEVESIMLEDLKEEYLSVIKSLETALKEIAKDE